MEARQRLSFTDDYKRQAVDLRDPGPQGDEKMLDRPRPTNSSGWRSNMLAHRTAGGVVFKAHRNWSSRFDRLRWLLANSRSKYEVKFSAA